MTSVIKNNAINITVLKSHLYPPCTECGGAMYGVIAHDGSISEMICHTEFYGYNMPRKHKDRFVSIRSK